MTAASRDVIPILLLGGYVMSFFFSGLQVMPNTSAAFVFAVGFFGYKLWDFFIRRGAIRTRPEVVAVIALFIYLVLADRFYHGGTILNPYYTAFGLNCMMLLLLVDEFKRHDVIRQWTMRIYVGVALFVSVFLGFGVLTSKGTSGRSQWLGQNENEIATALMIAFVVLSMDFVAPRLKSVKSRVLIAASLFGLMNAMIETGTRFTMISLIIVLLLLIPLVILERVRMKDGLSFVAASLVFLVLRTMNFAPMVERMTPSVAGNNLKDLGGRTNLWKEAIHAFKDSPLMGLGYDGYDHFISARNDFFELPHNFPLEIAATSGAIGIAFLVTISALAIVNAFYRGTRLTRLKAIVWIVPLALVMNMLNIVYLKTFWFLLACFLTCDFFSANRVTAESRTS